MTSDTAIWLDGIPTSVLPLPDRGLDFGDGLFETLLLKQGRPLYQDLHWQRLQKGLQCLQFPDCMQHVQACLERSLADLRERRWGWCALRLTVTRGTGPRGYAPPSTAFPRVIISAVALERDGGVMRPAARLTQATVRWGSQPALAGIKHLNRLEQVLAAVQCQSEDADEAVMLDQAGRPLSVTAGNLFVVLKGKVVTPPLRDCGIAGTRRQLVLEHWAPALGLPAGESELELSDVAEAEEVFYSNSLQGLRPVAGFCDRRWSRHEICEALYQQYRRDLA